MELRLYTPLGKVLECRVTKICLETLGGYRTLLPKHIDIAAALKDGILSYTAENGAERFAAVRHGIAVKKGQTVTVTVQNAVTGDTPAELEDVIRSEFRQSEESRKELNAAMARLEAGLVRGFNDLRKEGQDG